MSGPIRKDGRLESKTFLAFAARQSCQAASEPTPCDGRITVHHWPPKGMGGARRRDDRVAALCVRHHADAQQYRIPRIVQDTWVNDMRSRFLETATAKEMADFLADRKRWRESQGFYVEVES